MAKLFILFSLLMLWAWPGESFMTQREYIHMDTPCPPDERCPLFPEAVCKLDCLEVDDQGRGNDCVFRFYDANGVYVPCWM